MGWIESKIVLNWRIVRNFNDKSIKCHDLAETHQCISFDTLDAFGDSRNQIYDDILMSCDI